MTLDEFFEVLAIEAPRRHWELLGSSGRLLRGWAQGTPGAKACCPLTALTPAPNPALWAEAAGVLGLAAEDAEAVMRAADRGLNHNPTLRARLLAACGVEEVSP